MTKSTQSTADDVAITVKDVSKYFAPNFGQRTIKQATTSLFRKKDKYSVDGHWALKNINFEIKKGDFFGIVGRNGSGKSTLLKMIAGVYAPTEGAIHVNGRLIPFIELGVGFNPELSGRDNVFLNGALLGFNRGQMQTMYDEIVDFAELQDHMDVKLKNFSSGMQVRLAFSIAIRAEADILVLDEVLAVGDEAFQRKCYKYFSELKRKKKTVILVTHSMDSVQQYCTKAIMIEGGEVVKAGKPKTVAQSYRELFINAEKKTSNANVEKESQNKNMSAKVKFHNGDNKLTFDVSVLTKSDIQDAVITFVIRRDSGEIVYRWVSDEKMEAMCNLKKGKHVYLSVEVENIFPDGLFEVEVGVKSQDRTQIYANFTDLKEFEIINKGSYANDMFWKPKEKVSLKV